MSQRESYLTFSLNGVLYIFLYLVLVGFAIYDSLHFEDTWTLRVFHHPFFYIPNSFTLFLIDCLLNGCHAFFSVSSPRNPQGNTGGVPSLAPWLVSLGLLFESLCTAVRPVIPPVFSPSRLLICRRHANRQMFPVLLVFPSFILMS